MRKVKLAERRSAYRSQSFLYRRIRQLKKDNAVMFEYLLEEANKNRLNNIE